MIKRIIIRNGKKYIVNACGWEDGIGAGAPAGTLWLTSADDGNWYSVNASGSIGSITTIVDQVPIGYSDNSLGSQIVACDDGNSYFVYLTGTPNSVTFTVSQSVYGTASVDAKPYLLLRSTTDGNFYELFLHDIAGTITPVINQTPISGSWMKA